MQLLLLLPVLFEGARTVDVVVVVLTAALLLLETLSWLVPVRTEATGVEPPLLQEHRSEETQSHSPSTFRCPQKLQDRSDEASEVGSVCWAHNPCLAEHTVIGNNEHKNTRCLFLEP